MIAHCEKMVVLGFEGRGKRQSVLQQREGTLVRNGRRKLARVSATSGDLWPSVCKLESIGHLCVGICNGDGVFLHDFMEVLTAGKEDAKGCRSNCEEEASMRQLTMNVTVSGSCSEAISGDIRVDSV